MSVAAEMDFALGRGARREHTRQGSVTEEQQRPKAKDTQPARVEAEKGRALRYSSLTDPLRDMRAPRASRAAFFCFNGDTHSFLTGC